MDYTVVLDNNRETSKGYMGAYGINGIPHAFVVDREGRIAWHGHPMAGLDKALEKAAAAPVSPAATALSVADQKRVEAQTQLRLYSEIASTGNNPEKLGLLGEQLIAWDKELGGIEPGKKLDLAEVRRAARFQALTRDYQRAAAAGKSEAELQKIEQEAVPLAPAGFKFADLRGQLGLQRLFQDYYRAVTGTANAARIADLTAKLEAINSTEVEVLNEVAWTLLSDERIKTRNPKLALKFSQAAFDLTQGKELDVVDTYARALFDNGRTADAIAQQKRAVQLCDDKDRKTELEATLKTYEAGTTGK
jgi:hypothetical protein